MEIKEVLEERSWEEFLIRQPHAPFLQSWAWGEFQEKAGFSHRRLGLYKGGGLIGVCQVLIGRRRLGSFAYVPRGPVLKSFDKGEARSVLDYLKDFAAKEGVDYLRVEPQWEASGDSVPLLEKGGFRK